MRRWIVVVALGVLLALAAGIVCGVYGDDIRLAIALRQCNAARDRLRDYQSDFRVDAKLGPLNPSVSGTIAYLRPDSYRLELGDPGTPDCVLVKNAQAAYVSFPKTDLPVVEVEFPSDEEADAAVGSQSPLPWVEQLGEGSRFQWVGRDEVGGRRCSVVELVPPTEATADGGLILAPALGRRFADIPFVGSWNRTRVYLDRGTGLPIRGEALKGDGGVLFSWTASNVRVNQRLSDAEFGAAGNSARIIKRKYDPAHPERLFLPPTKGRSLLRRLGDALEQGAKDYLEDQIGGDSSGQSLGEHAIEGLTH